MSGVLHHDPSIIVANLLVDLGVGTDPSESLSWPIFYTHLPDAPDNAICTYDTQPIIHGRAHPTGVTQLHYGIQVIVRADQHSTGSTKARGIIDTFDTEVLRNTVTIGDYEYLVQAIHQQTDVIPLGPEGTSRRRRFSINATADIILVE